jgi:glycosyltransferase involved in cell wall biosynthesis
MRVGLICDSSTGDRAAEAALESLDELCDLGVRRITMHRIPGVSDLSTIRALRTILDNQSADIVHGHGAKGAAYARLLGRRLKARIVFTPHGGILHFSASTPNGRIYITLERVLRRWTSGAIFESEFAREAYVQKIGPITFPNCVVYNGVHECEYDRLPRGDEEYDFVFVGELRSLKGIYELIEATAAIRQERPVSLLMAGAGGEEARLRARIDELGAADSISLSPPIYPATKAFAQARCVVAPSLSESFPYIVLEALAAGVPVVTTCVGGIPEMFGPYAEQLIQAGDAGDLKTAMLAVLDDPDTATVNADALYQHVKQRFRVSSMADRSIAFYREIAGPGRN